MKILCGVGMTLTTDKTGISLLDKEQIIPSEGESGFERGVLRAFVRAFVRGFERGGERGF